ncbi:MAG: hypothetical protein V3U84_11735 [Thiotrichaceae bacterium]
MKAAIISSIVLTGVVFSIVACQSSTTAKPTEPIPPVVKSIECKDPRKQACTKEYRPVCAVKDTGVRCVTTPCPSTEKVTYANKCTACADAKVYSYVVGACK